MQAAPAGIECKYWVVLSEQDPYYPELLRLAWDNGYMILHEENRPLGRKTNVAVNAALSFRGQQQMDSRHWLMNIGSDDLVDPDYWELCTRYITEGEDHIYAVDRIYLCDEALTLAYRLITFNPGALRFIRLWAVQTLQQDHNKDLYPPELNRTLDGNSAANLSLIGVKIVNMVSEKIYIIDVKTNTNITSCAAFMRLSENGNFSKVPIRQLCNALGFYHPPKNAFSFKFGIPETKAIYKGMKVLVFVDSIATRAQVEKVYKGKELVELKPLKGKRFKNNLFSFHQLFIP